MSHPTQKSRHICWRYYFRSPWIKMMDRLSSLLSLQQQTAYTVNVHVSQGELLVGGSSKKIYRAKWLTGEKSPIVLLEIIGDETRQEVMLCLTLNHPHIVYTYGLVKPAALTQAHDTLLLLQEYAADGDLGNMLNARIFIPSEEVLIEIFIQIAGAMIYLSENNVVHGDLACRNVLVFQSHPEDPKKNCVKLIDFGLTRNDLSSSSTQPRIFPVRYAAPEILRSQGRSGYSEQSDAYSFAVLIWEACTGLVKIPFAHINDNDDVSRRKINGEKLSRPNKCSDQLWNLMLQCWSDTPRSRPTFQEISNRLKQMRALHSFPSPLP